MVVGINAPNNQLPLGDIKNNVNYSYECKLGNEINLDVEDEISLIKNIKKGTDNEDACSNDSGIDSDDEIKTSTKEILPKSSADFIQGWISVYNIHLASMFGDQVFIRQEVSLLEAATSFQTQNGYSIVKMNGNKKKTILTASEKSNVILRNILDGARPYEMTFKFEPLGDIFYLKRHLRTTLIPGFLQFVEIFTMDKHLLGTIEQKFNPLHATLKIKNHTGITLYKIRGPFWTISFFNDVKFQIIQNGKQCGTIIKKWSGLAKEALTDADNFEINFPEKAPVIEKLFLISATILIDSMMYETD